MTDEHERSPSSPPAPHQFHDGWWDAIIEAILEEIDGEREERERGLGR